MRLNVNQKLEIPLGGKRRLFIYVQNYNDIRCQINIYYYSDKPYDSAVYSTTEVFGISLSFLIGGKNAK